MKIAVLFCLLQLGAAYPAGGPLSICNDPYPHHHGKKASTFPTPYSITLSAEIYSPSDVITVKLHGLDEIKGFQLGAHSLIGSWGQLHGEFTQYDQRTVSGYTYYSPFVNCVSHNKNFTAVDEVEFQWKAPAESVGDIMFSATLMKDFATFWANITVELKAAVPANSSALVIPLLQIGEGMPNSGLSLSNCEKESGCITFPSDCDKASCRFTVSYMLEEGDKLRFRLTSRNSEPNYYLSLGLSTDVLMPKDEVFTCMNYMGRFEFSHGYTPAYYATTIRSDAISNVTMESVDGVFSCEFSRKLDAVIQYYNRNNLQNLSIDYSQSVNTPEYYLYLAYGGNYVGSKESASKHKEAPLVSVYKVALGTKGKSVFSTLDATVKLHATFMVLGYLVAAAIAMILARYFKDGVSKSGSTLCGLATWFQVHRAMAITCAVLTSAAFIIIFVHFREHYRNLGLHACFGIVVTCLTVLQILAGFIRPDNGAKYRKVFNWVHRLGGLVTYVLAAVTILLGTTLGYMHQEIKVTGTGLLAAAIAVQVIASLLLECISGLCIGSIYSYQPEQNAKTVEAMEMSKNNETRTSTAKSQVGLPFTVFTVYWIILLSFIGGFLYVLWHN